MAGFSGLLNDTFKYNFEENAKGESKRELEKSSNVVKYPLENLDKFLVEIVLNCCITTKISF